MLLDNKKNCIKILTKNAKLKKWIFSENQLNNYFNKKNTFPLIVPCHIVVSKIGYGGYMGNNKNIELHIKKELLKLEGVIL